MDLKLFGPIGTNLVTVTACEGLTGSEIYAKMQIGHEKRQMIISVPRETKESEARAALTPAGVGELVRSGHRVLVEESAGRGRLLRPTPRIS